MKQVTLRLSFLPLEMDGLDPQAQAYLLGSLALARLHLIGNCY